MFYQSPLRTITLIAALCFLASYASFGSYFAREIVIEIIILAILAISLDFCAGFGGMVSLCHGAMMGIAAYFYGMMSVKLGWGLTASAGIGLAAAVIFAGCVGWVTARISGIFFIMATLAFGQMAYTIFFRWRWLGGDDGMGGMRRFDLTAWGVNLNDGLIFTFWALGILLLVYILSALLLRSGFGRTLSGIHANEGRMQALGINTASIRTQSHGIFGFNGRASRDFSGPTYILHLARIARLDAIGGGAIGGDSRGIGTLVGPIIGAILLVLMKHSISAYTDYWHIFVGLVLIFAVLSGGRGIFGESEYWWQKYMRGQHA